jgi:glutamate-1-semialdehyde aminotransferase
LSATDANRFVLRLARALTGRPKILVFNYCYHGTVDETFLTLDEHGVPGVREGCAGSPIDPTRTGKVVEFNDIPALTAALADEDVAVVLAEPAMTNEGIILPDEGYHDALRELTRRHGTLLALDETHTICAGPGGATRAWGLEPDIITIGKPLAGGVAAASYGLSAELGERLAGDGVGPTGADGIGGTLAGNALTMAAMRATLEQVLTYEAFERMLPLGERWADGVQGVIDRFDAPWCVTRLGARAEYWTAPQRPRNGGEARATDDDEVDAYFHLYCLNRGVMLTPFHNMALMSPATTEADVDAHTAVFAAATEDLLGAV